MSYTMKASAEVVDLLDPNGDARRAGTLNLDAVPVAESASTWTPRCKRYSFRVWNNSLWRKETDAAYYGGYQIKYVSLQNTRLVNEWLNG